MPLSCVVSALLRIGLLGFGLGLIYLLVCLLGQAVLYVRLDALSLPGCIDTVTNTMLVSFHVCLHSLSRRLETGPNRLYRFSVFEAGLVPRSQPSNGVSRSPLPMMH